jgi:hypothetical protein
MACCAAVPSECTSPCSWQDLVQQVKQAAPQQILLPEDVRRRLRQAGPTASVASAAAKGKVEADAGVKVLARADGLLGSVMAELQQAGCTQACFLTTHPSPLSAH